MRDHDPTRRGALQCLAWAGSGAVFTMSGGVASSVMVESARAATPPVSGVAPFTFVQISDSHVGFKKAANPDVIATLRETIAKIKALPTQPDFIVHTGDITHLATPEQFDTAQQVLSELNLPIHYIPGEHDIVDGHNARPYVERFAPNAQGEGWYSFDVKGVHFVALVNVLQFVDSGTGRLGPDQLAWLAADLAPLRSSTPIVLLSHFPLWPLYTPWGWNTADGAQALALVKRFGSVTALNGHIHQIQQKVEGRVLFHAARSTAYPQPAPGAGPGPGPLLVPAEQLRTYVGLTSLEVRASRGPIPLLDATLA
jgi:hypothetical protein